MTAVIKLFIVLIRKHTVNIPVMPKEYNCYWVYRWGDKSVITVGNRLLITTGCGLIATVVLAAVYFF